MQPYFTSDDGRWWVYKGAPFPYFGGKSRIAPVVWQRLGNPPNFVEPFCGSCAVLLSRPTEPGIETINDLDGYVANFWRAISDDPEAVAAYADNPVFENDLHARHYWLKQQRSELSAMLEADPAYYDPQVAGWWAWGMSCWIGGGFCEGDGPWVVIDGKLIKTGTQGIERSRPVLDCADRCVIQTKGKGTERKRPQLVGPAGGNTMQAGQSRRRPNLTGDDVAVNAREVPRKRPACFHQGKAVNQAGIPDPIPFLHSPGAGTNQKGISRCHPSMGGAGGGQGTQSPSLTRKRLAIGAEHPGAGKRGVLRETQQGRLYEWFAALANRLARVRVCCGNWTRVMGTSVTIYNGLTGVFLDPPYAFKERSKHIYTTDTDCSAAVREWGIENGDNPLYRIALCGYDTEHDMPDTWECFEWKSDGGYANRSNSRGKANRHRERVWFSPHCIKPGDHVSQIRLMEV